KEKAANIAPAETMRKVETPAIAAAPPTAITSDGSQQLTFADANKNRAQDKSAPVPGLDLAAGNGRVDATLDEHVAAAKTDGELRDRSTTLTAKAPEKQPVTTFSTEERY